MKAHKHADLIHKWAEGEKIQKLARLCCDKAYAHWEDLDVAPMWHEDEEYRVKPISKIES